MSRMPRRTLLKAAAAAGAATQLSWSLGTTPASAATGEERTAEPVSLTWLESGGLGAAPGSTVGVPWPKGQYAKDQTFALSTEDGKDVPVQSWTTATWPDGSAKWTAHAVGPDAAGAKKFVLAPGTPAAPAHKVTVKNTGGTISVSTGVVTARIGKSGSSLITSLTRGSTEIAKDGRLVLIRQGEIEDGDQGRETYERFESAVTTAEVEQSGPVRAVVRVEGQHRRGKRSWLPFSVRLYFYAGAESFRMVHTITFDGTQEPGKASGDFIRGLGVRFTVPMRDEAYDRHIRIGGEDTGMLREAVKGITGLRRDPGAAVQAAQFEGTKLPDPATWDQRVTSRLHLIPTWGDYTLSQLSADGFSLRKRTKKGHGWIAAGGGGAPRASATSEGRAADSPSGCATSGRSSPPSSTSGTPTPTPRRSPSGSGRPRPSRWTCASTTTASARTRTRSSSKASTSPTRTTSPASAPPTASPARAN